MEVTRRALVIAAFFVPTLAVLPRTSSECLLLQTSVAQGLHRGPHVTPEQQAEIDGSIIERIPSSSKFEKIFKQRCGTLFNGSTVERARRRKPSFMHIPKTGGTALEKFMRIDVLSHDCAGFKKLTGNYVTLFRHPLDRLLSAYHFLESGERQNTYKERQAWFCQPETGKDFNQPCTPKQSFYDWIMSDGAWSELSAAPPFQFPCLAPPTRTGDPKATVEQVAYWVLQNTEVIGLTEDHLEFEVMLAKAFPGKVGKPARDVVKAVKHRKLAEALTADQYRAVALKMKDEISLYYWAKDVVDQLRGCYGRARLEEDLAKAKVVPASTEVIFNSS